MRDDSAKPRNIAHRGASSEAPENTLAAFRRAIEIGVDGIELDLHLSRDGELVVIHDDRLDRTTNGSGVIHAHSLPEIRRLDAGSWFNQAYPDRAAAAFIGEKVPTLQEVIELVRPVTLGLYLEIKHDAHYPPGVEEILVPMLSRNHFTTRVVIESFNHTILRNVKKLDAAFNVCVLFETDSAAALVNAKDMGAEELAPWWKLASREFLAAAHTENKRVVVWTVDESSDMLAMVARRVDAVITNYPSRLKQILDNR